MATILPADKQRFIDELIDLLKIPTISADSKYNDDIKSVLINNWKRDIDNFIIEFKKNSNNYINQYEKFIYDIVKKPLGDIQNIKLDSFKLDR